MKTKYILMICIAALCACNSSSNKEKKEIAQTYHVYGDTVTTRKLISPEKMRETYKNMQVGDTSIITLKAKVADVCQVKGCWMKLDLEDGTQTMVKFKEYGFFVPKDIKGKEVVVKGRAFLNEMSVEERRHYAEDAGNTKEEITAITEPLTTYSFDADGVLIAKENKQDTNK